MSSKQKEVFAVIKELTGQANVLTIPRAFIEFLGDHEQALFLSQLIYWSDKGKQPGGWFYKTYEDWYRETLLTEYKIRKARKRLEKEGIIQTKLKKANGAPVVHYKLDPEALSNWFLKKLQNPFLNNLRNDTEKTSESLTEITAENTTKTTNNKGILPSGENSRSFSFREFISLYEVDAEKIEVISYYLGKYKNKRKQEHPNLKADQWERVIDSLFYCVDENTGTDFDLDYSSLIDMIDQHFKTRYKNCDYNILHFVSDGVKVRRMYEAAY